MTPAVAVNGLTINLGGRPVVKQVDLTVDVGEFVTVLGTNGSGKSTLVRACIGLVPINAGSIELFGTPLAKFKSWHRLGYVPQQSNATSGVPATVYEVVMSGRLARRRFFGGRDQADLEAVVEAVERVGLTDRLRDSVTELSGGQQQRALIARALAAQAELLVMDEPTAGVDHANQESLAELLCGLVREGASILLVEHELGPLQPLIDRAVVLRAGEVVYNGSVDGVAAHEYAHMHPHTGQPTKPSSLSGEGIW